MVNKLLIVTKFSGLKNKRNHEFVPLSQSLAQGHLFVVENFATIRGKISEFRDSFTAIVANLKKLKLSVEFYRTYDTYKTLITDLDRFRQI